LWHLIIFVIVTTLFRPIYLLGVIISNRLNRIGLSFVGSVSGKSRSILSGILFRPRLPVLFIILCCIINLPTWGELIVNPIGSGLYFVLGYSLYRNSWLSMFLKAHWRSYLLAGFIGFTLYMILIVTESKNLATDIYSDNITSAVGKDIPELMGLLQYLLKITCGVLFSYAFIGLSESRFGSYNAKLRFIADGAYWMYLIHLPIVTLITFAMLDLQIPVEIKFVIAVGLTSTICLGTYKYLVRSTFIGLLLNGKRHPFKLTGL